MTSDADRLRLFRSCVHLRAESDYRWARDQSAIERVEGDLTVAFREEVERVLLDLADNGISVDLESIAGAFEAARQIVREGRLGKHALLYSRPRVVECLVVHAIENQSVARDADRAAAILAELALGWPMGMDLSEAGGDPVAPPDAPGSVDVTAGLAAVDASDLQRRMDQRTDRVLKAPRLAPLDPPEALPEVLPPATDLEAARRMARSMKEAVRLPRPGVRPEDSSVGGYADLAQRGSLDRLLLSELAHDDEVLAMRLVLGEALFLQRESTAETPRRERHVLVDASVRAWGEVRLVQMAAALAALEGGAEGSQGGDQRSDQPGAVSVLWRALSDRLERFDESASDAVASDLERFLSDLGTSQDASAVLQEFLRVTEASLADGVMAERVVVVPARSLKDAAYRAALEALGGCHVISVDAAGRLVLLAMGPRGSRVVRNATVEVVLPGGADLHGVAFDIRPMPDELPAYLGVWPAPLLASHPLEGCRWFESAGDPDRIYMVLRSKRVVLWTRAENRELGRRSGGREIGVLPTGHLRFWAPDGEAAAAAIWMPGLRPRLAIASLCPTKPPTIALLALEEEPRGFTVRGGVFGIGLRDRVLIASASRGLISTEVLDRAHVWRQDRARAVGQSDWRKLGIEGAALRWSRSGAPKAEAHRRGTLWRGTTKQRQSWIYSAGMIKAPTQLSIELVLAGKKPGDDTRLLLHGKGTRALRVRGGSFAPSWEGEQSERTVARRLSVQLTEVEHARHPAARFLKGAQLGNGSRIWSDARGLLHFASPDASLGQLTLVLHAEPPFTAWCSLGWKLDASAALQLKPGQAHPIGEWLGRFLAPLATLSSTESEGHP